MNVLLKKATILSSSSPHHRQVKDILIEDGIIKEISDVVALPKNTDEISGNGIHVSIGWMDIFADFAEPGNEHRESLETGADAAAAGGFTDVMLIPNTQPVVFSKSQVEFLKQRSGSLPVNIHPIGAITKDAEGNVLSEMYDMHASGAVAFSDGIKPVQQAGTLLKALQYVLAKDSVVIQLPDDGSISKGGLMNEGIISTQLGLPGNPAIAEELMIARDISLLRYSGSKLHITGVSTKNSLELIAAAKKEGLNITCSVTPHHLLFCDEDLTGYDTNLKVNPPLRNRENMQALQKAFAAGEIDCIAGHHSPQCSDDKICEFEYAKNGMISLQTLYGSVSEITTRETLINMLTENCRKIFGIDMPKIETGERACITVFEPETVYTFTENMIISKSRNTPFTGKKMKGRVIGIYNKNKWVPNQI